MQEKKEASYSNESATNQFLPLSLCACSSYVPNKANKANEDKSVTFFATQKTNKTNDGSQTDR